jgi:hypothetical protein
MGRKRTRPQPFWLVIDGDGTYHTTKHRLYRDAQNYVKTWSGLRDAKWRIEKRVQAVSPQMRKV